MVADLNESLAVRDNTLRGVKAGCEKILTGLNASRGRHSGSEQGDRLFQSWIMITFPEAVVQMEQTQ